jgi:TolB-like protein
MKIAALPSVFFATLVTAVRIWIASLVLAVLCAPSLAHAKTGPTVAVLYFDNNSGDTNLDSLSKGFADMLITDLSSSEKVTVVEREKLQALLDESKLQRSRFFDPKTAVKIGKGLGATHVVTGAFMTAKPKMRIDVRLIDIATGAVVLGSKVQGASDKIFDLEQELVGNFLKKLDGKFFQEDLPPTKVPNLKTLISYSESLGLVDLGQHQQAAKQLKSVIQMAPAFGLARVRHADILKRLEAAKTQRTTVLDQSSKTLFANAKLFISTNKFEKLDKKQAAYFLGYRTLMRHTIAEALREATAGRKSTDRIAPRKSSKKTLKMVRAYYENQRRLISEENAFKKRFKDNYVRATLPDADKKLADELDINYNDGDPETTMLRFLLHGRTKGQTEDFRISPAPVDLDKNLKKAALALSKALLKNASKLPEHMVIPRTVRVLEELATWHIRHERIEEGIARYQQILDSFPKLKRWSYYEKLIHQQLGLKHDFYVDRRKKYRKGLKNCKAWDIHVGHRNVLNTRIRTMGLEALPAMEKEVVRACKNSPELQKMKKSLYLSFALEAAAYDDCQWFDKYLAAWLKVGGSVSDSKGYRKNYSSCR